MCCDRYYTGTATTLPHTVCNEQSARYVVMKSCGRHGDNKARLQE